MPPAPANGGETFLHVRELSRGADHPLLLELQSRDEQLRTNAGAGGLVEFRPERPYLREQVISGAGRRARWLSGDHRYHANRTGGDHRRHREKSQLEHDPPSSSKCLNAALSPIFANCPAQLSAAI